MAHSRRLLRIQEDQIRHSHLFEMVVVVMTTLLLESLTYTRYVYIHYLV